MAQEEKDRSIDEVTDVEEPSLEAKPQDQKDKQLKDQINKNTDTEENTDAEEDIKELADSVDKEQLINILSLSDLKLELRIEIAHRKIRIQDLLNIKINHVIDLKCEVGLPVKVFLNKMLIGYANIIEMNDRYGIRIVRLISDEERLKFLQYEASK